MRVSVITAFPDFLRNFFSTSIIGKAVEKGLIEFDVIDLRDFAQGHYRQVDDYAFGGGGMVLMAEPLKIALESLSDSGTGKFVLYPSPQGAVLTQEIVESLASREHIVIICGHYEGIDERFVQKYVDLEVSIGDYVLTGGEIPAMAIIDSVLRQIPGVVGRQEAVIEDSFFRGMLDHPHFTRPAGWNGLDVPEVLTSGNKAEIDYWRRNEAVTRTMKRRPDMLGRANILPYLKKGVFVSLIHSPVYDRNGQKNSTAIMGLDLHDISRTCRTFGVKRFLVTSPVPSQREFVRKITKHWIDGYGASFIPSRGEALKLIRLFPDMEKACKWVEDKEHGKPYIIATSANIRTGSLHWLELKRMVLETDRPLLFVFGTGWGLHDEIIEQCDAIMQPIKGGNLDYNHLSVRSAVAVTLDRFFGSR